ncbi:CALCIUM-BINDING PROTEIN CML27-RELATED, partial [Salix koriyanagi]
MATPISNPNPETAAPKSSTAVNIDDTSELRRVFEQFDTNEVDTDKDGHIDVTEFAQLCRSSSSSAAASEMRDAFDLYDQNGDGMISATELHQVLNRLGMKCKVDECLQMIKNVDSDGDG